MNLKKVALSLLLGGSLFAVGCGDDDASDATVPIDSAVPTCDVAGDADSMTKTFTIEHLSIPASNSIGLNLDGIISTTNQDVAGCRKIDGAPGGIDNALAEILGEDGLGDLLAMAGVNINTELQKAVDSDAIALTVQLTKWNGTADDTCVGVTIAGSSAGSPITSLTGGASLVASKINLIAFSNSLRIVPTFMLSPDGGLGTCTMNCINAALPITISGVRARIVFNTAMDAIVVGPTPNNTSSTMVAGFVKFTGTDDSAFQTGLHTLIMQIKTDLVPTVDAIFNTYLDLDESASGGLTACTSTGGGAVSADSFSAAILADGLQVP